MGRQHISLVATMAACSVFPDALPEAPDGAAAGGRDTGAAAAAGVTGGTGARAGDGAGGRAAEPAEAGGAGAEAGRGGADAAAGGDARGSGGVGADGGGADAETDGGDTDASAGAGGSGKPDATADVADDRPTTRVVAVAAGATWKYLDDGAERPGWRAPGFDDSGWKAGPAELGYGDGDEATVVGFGPDPLVKFTTTWFRRSFEVKDAASVASATVSVVRDDGIVVHLNGVEVARSNLPAGAITADTLGSAIVSNAEESTWLPFPVALSPLVTGTNTLAIEIHQQRPDSSDISFNLELILMVR